MSNTQQGMPNVEGRARARDYFVNFAVNYFGLVPLPNRLGSYGRDTLARGIQ